ncbi:Amino Acid/Auxin Permease [Phytophthora megakarya]|uniref:Amino Acid/Auxin Permease n=1 Tax=Phytophthora megakarya TaxID=4795 RepID=A0A225VWU3_9STRA|nr:Amino Acid/Auxin Permease [Phytophthora megakarya]
MAPNKNAIFTFEDAKAAFNIFCCVCGIGSLGMPSNYARAGWLFASIALVFMAFANIYASVLLSKVLLAAPPTVKTYGDLGEWVAGKGGRLLVTISQMGVCLLLPCAFLVLGGSLLDVLFPDCFSQSVWIIFMALMVVPVALIPTMKESTGMAIGGCLGTIVADIIGIGILLYEERGHPTAPTADVTMHQVITTFGNLSLAYAAATVIPDLQREHSQPERMPRVIMVSLGIASAFFIAVGTAGYAAGGCQMSGNLLFSVANTENPYEMTTLGFVADRGAVVMAYLFMQMHLSIAFSTFLHPAFYMFERMLLGMHKVGPVDFTAEEKISYLNASTPADLESNDVQQRVSRVPVSARQSHTNTMIANEDLSEYKGGANVMRYILMRIALITVLVVLSILLRSHFLDLVDFTGATFITLSSLIVPLIFYIKVFWTKVPAWEKLLCVAVAAICTVCGVYVMIYAGKNLFNPDEGDEANFPYCSAEYQDEPYYVRNETA